MRISDWSSDVCSSDLAVEAGARVPEADPENHSVGYGGYPDRDGHVTLDAIIMDEDGRVGAVAALEDVVHAISRSEEHTSELQSLMRISYAVFCLKKKKKTSTHMNNTSTTMTMIDTTNHYN